MKNKLPDNLIVHCQEHLDTVLQFAEETGQIDQLLKELCSLPTWFGGKAYAHLYSDFAPYSFFWTLNTEREPTQANFIMNGGLIYHGSHDRGGDGGAPTFSCNLTPMNGWAIHT